MSAPSKLATRPETGPSSRPHTLGELMVAAAAREIRDGEVVFVGMRLPMIAFVVAKKTHAPSAVGLFENGVIRSTPSPELIYTMADPPNLLGATYTGDMLTVMSLLQSGRANLGFLGAAEVDKYGNLNTTQVRMAADRGPRIEDIRSNDNRHNDQRRTTTDSFIRLPGSGGACDIASLAQRFVVLLEHSRHRLPERVSFITSPGNGEGQGWRQRVGLPRGGPAAVITTKAVLRFGEDGEAYLDTIHPGVTREDVLANTGWRLRVSSDLRETTSPSVAELEAIRDYDKEGFWTK